MDRLSEKLKSGSYALAPDIVLTPSGPLRDQVLRVENGRIAEIAARDPSSSAVAQYIRLDGAAIIPGFVDSHTHAGQTFGKSLICGEPTQIWRRIWIPLEDALTPERSYVAAKWMFLEALRGGFTTLVNFNRNSPENNDAVHEAARDSGIRLVSGVAASSDSSSVEKVIAGIEHLVARCGVYPRITPSLCFGFYAASLEGLSFSDLARIGEYCAKAGIVLQMHSNEHFPDVHDCIVRFKKRPIELWEELGLLGENTLLHHVTLVSAREKALLEKYRVAISYNPVASQWKGNAVAPALDYAERGIRMGLGTDATRMDGFRMLDAAENCQRIAHGMSVLDFACAGGWTWVDAATRGGADACGLGKVTGALTPGRAADFLVLDMTAPEVVPSWDFEWELVRAYDRDQIRLVVVDGNPVLENGAAVGWDSAAFVREGEKLARAMVTETGITRVHPLSSSLRSKRA